MKVTLLGAGGMIGTALRARLADLELRCPGRRDTLRGEDLGVLVYCAGLTADFRDRAVATFEAHVATLAQLLAENRCSRVIYLSSTRVYLPWSAAVGAAPPPGGPLDESAVIPVSPLRAGDVYTISKLAGESLVLAHHPNNLVLRLSNVVGPPSQMQSFLGLVLAEIESSGRLVLQSHPDSARDYITLDTVSGMIEALLRSDTRGVVNVCNGYNLTHRDWLTYLATRRAFELLTNPGSSGTVFPLLSNDKLQSAVGFQPEPPERVFAALGI